MLQRLEPVQQGGVSLPERFSRNPLVCDFGHRALLQCRLLGADRDLGVPICRLQAGVAKPGTNDIHLDARFQEVHGCTVPPGVW